MRNFAKIICCLTFLAIACVSIVSASPINDAGYFKGIKLCGKVKVVEWNGDIKVQIVEHFPNLKVQVVDSFPDEIGQWQFVSYGEDFTIQYVDSFPDIKVQFVEHFPGVE